jgi:hypothetical protein
MTLCVIGAAAFTALVELGADHRALSASGWPPLFYAVENRHGFASFADELNC